MTSGCGGAEEEEEEDLTRWLLAYCLEKSGSGEEHIHMCSYVRVCVQSCTSVVCFKDLFEFLQSEDTLTGPDFFKDLVLE